MLSRKLITGKGHLKKSEIGKELLVAWLVLQRTAECE